MTNEKKTLAFEQRLAAYNRQASIASTKTIIGKKYHKGALMSVATLAAVGAMPSTVKAQAQVCAGVMVSSRTANSCSDYYLDLNGNGAYDINLFLGYNYTNTSYYLAVDAFNGMIGTPQAGSFTIGAANTSSRITAPNTVGAMYTIPVELGGQLGFINVTISAGGCPMITAAGVGTATTIPPNPSCSDLPVELSNFQAVSEANHVLIKWETLSELNNLGFELERSTNGKDFEKIAWIEGNGTTVEAQSYHFKDLKVQRNGLYYYRLKQLDTDGQFEYSEVITVELEDKDVVRVKEIYPNPTSTTAVLEIESPKAADANIHVYTATGQLLKSIVSDVQVGANILSIDVQDLPQGSYFLKIVVANEMIYRKFVKQQ